MTRQEREKVIEEWLGQIREAVAIKSRKLGFPMAFQDENTIGLASSRIAALESLRESEAALLEACSRVLLYDANQPLDSGCLLCKRHDEHAGDCPMPLCDAAIIQAYLEPDVGSAQ